MRRCATFCVSLFDRALTSLVLAIVVELAGRLLQ